MYRYIQFILRSTFSEQFDLGSTLYLIETPFNAFANRTDPGQAALVTV